MKKMWIYAFGSLVRGEMDPDSDVDILFIGLPDENRSAPSSFLCYTKDEVTEIFKSGDLFAHHLYNESRLIYSYNGTDFLDSLVHLLRSSYPPLKAIIYSIFLYYNLYKGEYELMNSCTRRSSSMLL